MAKETKEKKEKTAAAGREKTLSKRLPVIAAILLIAVTTVISTYVLSKYTTTTSFVGSIQISEALAASLRLLESQAVQEDDGSYSLTSTAVTSNTYKLIPGLTIPKDPYIEITGKTPTPAYLYVEVLETAIDLKLTYSIDSAWSRISGLAGPHGGNMYVYGSTASGTLIDNTMSASALSHISILTDDEVLVDVVPITSPLSEVLQFWGYMIQPASAGANAQTSFTGNFPTIVTP